jgi:hypothetical protein
MIVPDSDSNLLAGYEINIFQLSHGENKLHSAS